MKENISSSKDQRCCGGESLLQVMGERTSTPRTHGTQPLTLPLGSSLLQTERPLQSLGMGLTPRRAHLPHPHAAPRPTGEQQLSSVPLSRGSSNRKIQTFPVASRLLGEMTIRPLQMGLSWMGEAFRGCPTPVILV